MKTIFYLFCVLTSIAFFIESFSEMHLLTHPHYHWIDVLQYAVLITPRNTYDLFALTITLSSFIYIYQIRHYQELIAAQSFGMSLRSLITALMIPICCYTLFAFALGEGIAPQLTLKAKNHRQQLLHGAPTIMSGESLWLYNNPMMIHATYQPQSKTLKDITLYKINGNNITSFIHADFARYINHNWHLYAMHTIQIHPKKLTSPTANNEQITIKFSPKLLALNLTDHYERSVFQLYQAMHLSKGNNLYQKNKIFFYKKLCYPFACIALALFSLAFSILVLTKVPSYQQFFLAIITGISTYSFYTGLCFVFSSFNLAGQFGSCLPIVMLIIATMILCGLRGQRF